MQKTKTLKETILEIIALSGEVRRRDLFILPYAQEYMRKTIADLKTEGMIRESDFEGVRTFRLSNAGKKWLMGKFPGRYESYLSGNVETNKIRSEPQRRERNLRMGQLMLMLGQTNVKLFPDEKHLLKQNSVRTGADGTDCTDNITAEFYSSVELKHLIADYKKSRSFK